MGGALRYVGGVRRGQRTNVHRFNRQTIEEDHLQVQEEDLRWFLLGDEAWVVAGGVGWGGGVNGVGGVSHAPQRHQCDRQWGCWGGRHRNTGLSGCTSSPRQTGDAHRRAHTVYEEWNHWLPLCSPLWVFFYALHRRIHTHCVAATLSPWIRAAAEKTNQSHCEWNRYFV